MKITKLFMLWVLCLIGTQGYAQNVTIKATNGSMIPAVKDYGTEDSFFPAGGFATWQHEQLCMVLTVSDNTNLTPNGQLDNPANNLFSDGTHIQMAHGRANDANVCYASISLPSGYRFTGYTIKFSKPGQLTKGNNIEFNNANAPSTLGETGKDFGTFITSAAVARNGSAQTITRTGTEDNMGNVLYFKMQDPTNSRALITIEYAEFWFTAEDNYSPLTPAGEITSPVSAVDVPFSTSKVDYGRIEQTIYFGNSRIAYSSANVTDLEANFTLYEAESIKDGVGIDDINGKVVDYKAGSISSVGGYFKFDSPNKEQVYYIETPTYVELSDGNKNPIGYRIVGAEFDYATKITATRTFYITYTYNGTKRYLNTDGHFTTTRTIWEMDPDGYISSNGNYLYYDNGYCATQNYKPEPTERFAFDTDNNIYQVERPTYFICGYRQQGWTTTTYYGLITPDNYTKAKYEEINAPTESVDPFTLKVYDKEGANPKTINVTGNGKYTLNGLNNDAVKFGIQGTGLLRATLTLQALDPYLDQMQVVCQDEVETAIRMNEGFTASDFSVSGGEFYFYLPEDCKNHSVAITFEDLKSKYFDETYTGGHSANTSRINFVKSLHYNAFGTPNNNNVYSNVNEAKDAQLERLKVGIVGTQPFKFNNADEVGTSGVTYREYPFSLEKYAATPNNGSFNDMKFTVTAEDQVKTRYVFTTDETRYNIAPTTATQHRAYAFYTMIVHVMTSTYSPEVTFTPIYAHTNYDNSAAGGSVDEDKAFYGAKVTATDGNGKAGYSSIEAIYDAIQAKIKDGGNVPKSEKEILYFDLSEMAGVYHSSNAAEGSVGSFEALIAKSAANSLIFLPVGVSASINNVAYKLEGGSFKAANNIVLTDKQPFYSPYSIQVDAERYAKYTRNLTYDGYDKDVYAMVILPYEMTLEGGKHINPAVDGQSSGQNSFWVKEMKSASLVEQTRSHDYGIAYFGNVDGEKTTANYPYMVMVDENTVTGDDISFVAIEKGALIQATSPMSSRTGTGEEGNYSYDYLFNGETVNGTVNVGTTEKPVMMNSVTLKSEGSFSGQKYDRADSEAIFYFANNMFYNLYKLMRSEQYRYLYAYPFHPVYSFTGQISNNVKALGGLDITLEPDDVDGIRDIAQVSNPDLAVRSGKGFIQFTSVKDQAVNILSLNGTTYGKVTMNAGDSRTVSLPAGVYVVNNVKIIVK